MAWISLFLLTVATMLLARFMDIPVQHIREFAPDTSDVNLLAIANNEFHQYILHLYMRDDFAHYQNIAILHDIQIAQNLRGPLPQY